MREGCGGYKSRERRKGSKTVTPAARLFDGSAGGVAALPRTAHALILWKGSAQSKGNFVVTKVSTCWVVGDLPGLDESDIEPLSPNRIAARPGRWPSR